MLKIELVPTLSQCIETVAKREYQETVQRLLSAEEVSDKLKEKTEILTKASSWRICPVFWLRLVYPGISNGARSRRLSRN